MKKHYTENNIDNENVEILFSNNIIIHIHNKGGVQSAPVVYI